MGSVVLGLALPWIFLGVLNLSQRNTPNYLQGGVSAAMVLALFVPQAPMEALGAQAITETSYRVLYVGTALIAIIALWLTRSTKTPTNADSSASG